MSFPHTTRTTVWKPPLTAPWFALVCSLFALFCRLTFALCFRPSLERPPLGTTDSLLALLKGIKTGGFQKGTASRRQPKYCHNFGGLQKGGFQKGGFGGCPPGTKTGTRVRSPKPPFYETALLSPSEKPLWCWKGGFQKGGFGGCSPGTKTGTRVRSPKPPFYETALLSPSEICRDSGHDILRRFFAPPSMRNLWS